MRTKTLLLTAAISAAGIATSLAQVFSVNVVGYVTKAVPANKFVMLANPLNAATNTINALFKGVPAGFQVYKFDSAKSAYTIATFDDLDNAFAPPAAGNATVVPGEGVFVKSATATSVTFVGEVMQGTLTTQLPKGLSIVASQVPQAGTPKALGLATGQQAGDQIYQWNADTGSYKSSTFDDLDNDFLPALTIDVGEAFFISKRAAGTWTRTFTVSQ